MPSIGQQCKLLSIARSSFYYVPKGETEQNLSLMRLIDEQFLETPFLGVRQMTWQGRRRAAASTRVALALNQRSMVQVKVGDQRQVIRGELCRPIRPAPAEHRSGLAIDAVKRKEWPESGKGFQVAVPGKEPVQYPLHRPSANPVIEVAHEHRAITATLYDLRKLEGLLVPFLQTQAQMRCQNVQRTVWRMHHRFDCGAGFPLSVGDIVKARPRHRPATNEGMAVVAIRGAHQAAGMCIAAQFLGQICEGIGLGRRAPARVDFLKRDDLRLMTSDKIDHTLQIIAPIRADPAVNVPGHDANDLGRGAVHGNCQARAPRKLGYVAPKKIHLRIEGPALRVEQAS